MDARTSAPAQSGRGQEALSGLGGINSSQEGEDVASGVHRSDATRGAPCRASQPCTDVHHACDDRCGCVGCATGHKIGPMPEEMLMQRIVVLNPKGGSGKTTIAINIASYFALQGDLPVIIDHD